MKIRLAPVRKAVLAYLLPLLAAAGAALIDGDLTRSDLYVALGTSLVTGTGVYNVRNDGE